MQNIQNKIDRLIQNGNEEFSQQSNVIGAMVEYSRIKELFNYLDRKYKVQIHEVLVRIAICWDILGNYSFALEYLNKALEIIKNIPCLVIYQSFLKQSMKMDINAQEDLRKYKRSVGKKQEYFAKLFRIVFYYTGKYDREILISEINDYFAHYPKCTVLLYIRALMTFELAKVIENDKEKVNNRKGKTYNELMIKYEKDINEASQLEANDTKCLIRDGITRENITKLFFMIVPEMDYYQPKPLVNYSSFQCGFKLFYILLKCIKLFKTKLQKKKLKTFYIRKIKLMKLRDSSPDGVQAINYSYHNNTTNDNNKNTNSNDNNNSNNKRSSKSPLQSSDRKGSETLQCELIQLKKAYENKLNAINSSVFFVSMNLYEDISKYDLDIDIFSNYFIRNKYYAPFNLNSNILSLKEISHNDDPFNKSNTEDSIGFSNHNGENKFDYNEKNQVNKNLMLGFGNCIVNNCKQTNNLLQDLSVSLIKAKPNQECDFNVTNELEFFDQRKSLLNTNRTISNANSISKKIPDLFNIKHHKVSKPIDSIKKIIKIDLKQNNAIINKGTKENIGEVQTPKSSVGVYNNKIKENINKKQLVLLNCEELCKMRRVSPDIIGKKLKMKLVFWGKKRIFNRQSNNSNRQECIDLKSQSNNQQDNTGKINNTNEY